MILGAVSGGAIWPWAGDAVYLVPYTALLLFWIINVRWPKAVHGT